MPRALRNGKATRASADRVYEQKKATQDMHLPLGKTIEENLRILERYRAVLDYVELRAIASNPASVSISAHSLKKPRFLHLTIRRKQMAEILRRRGVRSCFLQTLSFQSRCESELRIRRSRRRFPYTVIEEACHTSYRIVVLIIFTMAYLKISMLHTSKIAQKTMESKTVVNPQSSADSFRF